MQLPACLEYTDTRKEPANNMFIFFSCSKLVLQPIATGLCWFVCATSGWILLFQFCLLIGLHCLGGPSFSKRTVTILIKQYSVLTVVLLNLTKGNRCDTCSGYFRRTGTRALRG